jgi:hypothetical protein
MTLLIESLPATGSSFIQLTDCPPVNFVYPSYVHSPFLEYCLTVCCHTHYEAVLICTDREQDISSLEYLLTTSPGVGK